MAILENFEALECLVFLATFQMITYISPSSLVDPIEVLREASKSKSYCFCHVYEALLFQRSF